MANKEKIRRILNEGKEERVANEQASLSSQGVTDQLIDMANNLTFPAYRTGVKSFLRDLDFSFTQASDELDGREAELLDIIGQELRQGTPLKDVVSKLDTYDF